MICRLLAQKTTDGWLLRMDSDPQPATPFVTRTIRAVAQNAVPLSPLLPMPPLAESSRWAGKPHAVLCGAPDFQTIDAVYHRLLENNPKADEVALFGDYLTAVLLGPNLDILEASSSTPVDLRLVLDDPNLQRLPWEMMYGPPANIPPGPNAPLSARPNRRFAINREVPLAAGDVRTAPHCESPLKVLFVAESKIDNLLRPGAEFLGLLRHLRIPVSATFQGDFVSASIRLRFLPEADIDELKSECRKFQPSVLHFICHGESDPGGGPSRIILRGRDPGSPQGESRPRPVTADRLVDELTEDNGWLPPVFVLNACYTATLPNQPARIEDAHLPFAAQIVRRGAAVAVGMAGEVADPACQMFTLRFYQALVTGTCLIDAASQARRAVLTAWPEYQQSIEWSRPALFLASGLDGTVHLNSTSTFQAMLVAERFRQDGAIPRMMCGRYEMMVAYDRLVSLTEEPGYDPLLVAFTVEDSVKGLGKTRLLEEFAIRSVVDGFLPCLIRADGEMPRSLLDFALTLTETIDVTRRNFRVASALDSEAMRLAFEALNGRSPSVSDRQAYRSLRSTIKNIPAESQPSKLQILDAIRKDCAQLAADVEAVTNRSHRVLLLFDEFDRWVGAYDKVLENVDFAGLGTPEIPIPVVLNYVTSSAEGQNIQKKLKRLPPERRPELRRFETEVDREIVYRQLLLSEWRRAPKQTREAAEVVKKFFGGLHSRTGGLPQTFLDPKIESFIDGFMYAPNNAIVDADYETALRAFGA
jgi:hypothetical protein